MTATRCRGCDRPLRDPVSRERGYGSQCWQDHKPAGALRRRSPVLPRRRTAPVTGQIPLDIETEPQENP